jgi:N6-L-threonylcarbamoyladenine synthase
MHTEWIYGVVDSALKDAGLVPVEVEGVAVTGHPGLLGSLLVGLHFAKAFAWARNIPFIAVDHLLAHLYASRLEPAVPAGPTAPASAGPANPAVPEYPFIGLLVSGGHSAICRVDDFDNVTVLGTTIDDAVGEAFDKVAKFYGFGYPGGAVIDKLAKNGDCEAFKFPMPNLYKTGKDGNDHRCDFSYSGLKTAVVNQLEQFRVKPAPPSKEAEAANIAASFQKTAIDILLRGLFRAVEDTGLQTIVAGGGVAANSRLRSLLSDSQPGGHVQPDARRGLRVIFPPMELCGDNGAMVAGIGERYLLRGDRSPLSETASARVKAFRRKYP